MTNFDRWQEITSGLPSPQNFIDWSIYSCIGSALGRRVWCPPDHDRVYGNMYTTLVGDPGVGKGGPIRMVSSLLTEHKLEDAKSNTTFKGEEKTIADAVVDSDNKIAQEDMVRGKGKDATMEKPLLIPVAADAVTYEALVQSMSYCLRRINYVKTEEDGKQRMAIYSHSSQTFCLEEIASLFRKHQNDLINFLIQAYDCGESYEYRTKTSGRDRILRICVNFLGGTTPSFMQEVFDDALVNQGYSSRTFYIYGAKDRKTVFFRPELTIEQREYKKELSAHVKTLTGLYGPVKLDNSTINWLQKWYAEYREKDERSNTDSGKLKAFKARLNIHVMKLAMAMHFLESAEMYIPQSTFELSIDKILKEMSNMKYALCIGGTNPLAKTSNKILEYLQNQGRKTETELLTEFWEKINKSQLQEVINFLTETDQAVVKMEKDEHTDITNMYYYAKRV